jgi:hypothetical protein
MKKKLAIILVLLAVLVTTTMSITADPPLEKQTIEKPAYEPHGKLPPNYELSEPRAQAEKLFK